MTDPTYGNCKFCGIGPLRYRPTSGACDACHTIELCIDNFVSVPAGRACVLEALVNQAKRETTGS